MVNGPENTPEEVAISPTVWYALREAVLDHEFVTPGSFREIATSPDVRRADGEPLDDAQVRAAFEKLQEIGGISTQPVRGTIFEVRRGSPQELKNSMTAEERDTFLRNRLTKLVFKYEAIELQEAHAKPIVGPERRERFGRHGDRDETQLLIEGFRRDPKYRYLFSKSELIELDEDIQQEVKTRLTVHLRTVDADRRAKGEPTLEDLDPKDKKALIRTEREKLNEYVRAERIREYAGDDASDDLLTALGAVLSRASKTRRR